MAFSTAAVTGSQARLGYKTGSGTPSWGSGAKQHAFLSEGMIKQEQVISDNVIRGTRSHSEEQCRAGTYEVGGPVSFVACPNILEDFLPHILGAAKASDTPGANIDRYGLAETLPEFALLIDKVGAVYEYKGCQVDQCQLTASKDQPVQMNLSIRALEQSNTSWNSSVTAIAVAANSDPYIFHDFKVEKLGGETGEAPVDSFTLTVNNSLTVDHRNSQAPTTILPHDREILLDIRVPFNSDNEGELYSSTSDSDAKISLNNGTFDCEFHFKHLKQIRRTAIVPGKSDLGMDLSYRAYASSFSSSDVTTMELYVDLDNTV